MREERGGRREEGRRRREKEGGRMEEEEERREAGGGKREEGDQKRERIVWEVNVGKVHDTPERIILMKPVTVFNECMSMEISVGPWKWLTLVKYLV